LPVPSYKIAVAIRSSESGHSVRTQVGLVLRCGPEGRTSDFPPHDRHFSYSTGKHTQTKDCSGWRWINILKRESAKVLLPDISKNNDWLESSQASPAFPSDKSGIKMKMSVEVWWTGVIEG